MTKREAMIKLLEGERVRMKSWPVDYYWELYGERVVNQDHEELLSTKIIKGIWQLDDDWELFTGPQICKFSELYDLLQPGDHATYADNATQASLRLYEDGHREINIKCGGVIKSSISREELQATWTIHRGGKS